MTTCVQSLHLSFATKKVAASLYQSKILDQHDVLRVETAPHLAHQADWQVSRVLKYHAHQRHSALSCLSHRKGHAAHADGNSLLAIGIDLEHVTPRNWSQLCPLFCTEYEYDQLARNHYPQHDAYALWTLKEALLKADNLSFPADIRRVGWQRDNAGNTALHSPRGNKWAGITLLLDQQWLLSAVWLPSDPHVLTKLVIHADYWNPACIEQYALWGIDAQSIQNAGHPIRKSG